MKSFGIVAAVAAAIAAAPALAAPEWVRVGAHVDRGAVEVDRQSLSVRQGLRRATWRVHYAEPKRDGTATDVNRELIDCRDGLTATLGVTSLADDGTIVNRTSEGEEVAMRRLSPATEGTTGAMVAQAICRMPIPKPPVRKVAKKRH